MSLQRCRDASDDKLKDIVVIAALEAGIAESCPVVDAARGVVAGCDLQANAQTSLDPGQVGEDAFERGLTELAPGNWTDCLTRVLISPSGERADKQ